MVAVGMGYAWCQAYSGSKVVVQLIGKVVDVILGQVRFARLLGGSIRFGLTAPYQLLQTAYRHPVGNTLGDRG